MPSFYRNASTRLSRLARLHPISPLSLVLGLAPALQGLDLDLPLGLLGLQEGRAQELVQGLQVEGLEGHLVLALALALVLVLLVLLQDHEQGQAEAEELAAGALFEL